MRVLETIQVRGRLSGRPDGAAVVAMMCCCV